MAIPRGPQPNCPICGEPCKSSTRRPVYWLDTCGKRSCSYELRAQKTRGNRYGARGGGPQRSTGSGYSAVHHRARRAFQGRGCDLADDTCAGRIEVALRADVPPNMLAADEYQGTARLYYTGRNTEDAYRPLCRSHHGREGALRAAATRLPRVAAALAADRMAAEHTCAPDCQVCALLEAFDAAGARLLEAEAAALRQRAEEMAEQSGRTCCVGARGHDHEHKAGAE